jgi:hypothetical protein
MMKKKMIKIKKMNKIIKMKKMKIKMKMNLIKIEKKLEKRKRLSRLMILILKMMKKIIYKIKTNKIS